MRVKRVVKFKKHRSKKMKKLILMGVILPFASIFLGYLVTCLLILPILHK